MHTILRSAKKDVTIGTRRRDEIKISTDRPARLGGGNDRFDRNPNKPTALFAVWTGAHGCGFDHADRFGLYRPA